MTDQPITTAHQFRAGLARFERLLVQLGRLAVRIDDYVRENPDAELPTYLREVGDIPESH